MNLAVLDGFEAESSIGDTLKNFLEKRNEKFSYFKLRDMNILPCRSCGACGLKTPGQCVIKDDISEVIRAMAQSDMFVFLTPIRFGGYSSQLKKAIDRTMALGTPFYMVKQGHLLHPMRYGSKAIVGIGLVEKELEGQEENFRTLVSRNALNMQSYYSKALIFKPSDSLTIIENEIDNALRAAR